MTGNGRGVEDGSGIPDGSGIADGRGIPDGRYVAVLDRFEATDPARDVGGEERASEQTRGRELAVLLLESGDEVIAERHVPSWRLPEDARHPDAVLEVSVRNGHVVSMVSDLKATERRSSEAQSRFDRLAQRPGEQAEVTDEGKSDDGGGEKSDDGDEGS